ncbi:DUF2254 family protein [Streptomyces sp. NPDC006463]|uniref:DUF2254 family protein n=1 Tax=Streptomyces sp. NPDC006463 TaxID=3364746 RepID=UPI00369B1402
MTCIDWLGSSLCQITDHWHPSGVHRDTDGVIRVISTEAGYDRLAQRSFEKIRQAGSGMPRRRNDLTPRNALGGDTEPRSRGGGEPGRAAPRGPPTTKARSRPKRSRPRTTTLRGSAGS